MNTPPTLYPDRDKDEAIYVFVRPAFLGYLPTLIGFLILFGIGFFSLLGIILGAITPSTTLATPIVAALGIFQLLTILVFLVATLDYYMDLIIVTDIRLVSINHQSLFYRKVSELLLEDTEDAVSEVKTFLQTFFNYGDVTIQTAGEKPNFILHNYPHPREIASIVNDLAKQAKDGVAHASRKPNNQIIGVINNRPMQSFRELSEAGAITSDDPRRQQVINNQNNQTTPPSV
jgi:hypothetical protein